MKCLIHKDDKIVFMPKGFGGLGVGEQSWVNSYCLFLKQVKGRKTLNNRKLRDSLFTLIISFSTGKAVD